mmetsp:Transcript_58840/g.189210  ORF Transcript_58840/g.189210 Transcript_58840/m.189210 type:complete len:128 (-) Transcript_58840:155-538(-)
MAGASACGRPTSAGRGCPPSACPTATPGRAGALDSPASLHQYAHCRWHPTTCAQEPAQVLSPNPSLRKGLVQTRNLSSNLRLRKGPVQTRALSVNPCFRKGLVQTRALSWDLSLRKGLVQAARGKPP